MLRKKISDQDIKIRDAVRKYNADIYDPETAPTDTIYVGIPWERRSAAVPSAKRKCDKCGQTLAVDKANLHMVDNSSEILCMDCAITTYPEQFIRDVKAIRERLKRAK